MSQLIALGPFEEFNLSDRFRPQPLCRVADYAESPHVVNTILYLSCCYFFTILEQMTKRDFLGNFELIVMLALMRLREDAYGVPISREIEERIGREVALASVYATLERLESKGLGSSEVGEPTPERGGGRTKC